MFSFFFNFVDSQCCYECTVCYYYVMSRLLRMDSASIRVSSCLNSQLGITFNTAGELRDALNDIKNIVISYFEMFLEQFSGVLQFQLAL